MATLVSDSTYSTSPGEDTTLQEDFPDMLEQQNKFFSTSTFNFLFLLDLSGPPTCRFRQRLKNRVNGQRDREKNTCHNAIYEKM